MTSANGSDLRNRFEAVVGASPDAAAVGDSLFSVAGALSQRPTVRRALIDAGRTAESREEFARRLFGGRVDDSALDIIAAAIGERWSRPSEFNQAIADLGVQAYLASAQAHDRLASVEDELFRFGQILRAEPALRSALTDQAAPRESKQQLIHRLLGEGSGNGGSDLEGKAQPETVRLVDYAVLDGRAGSLESRLEHIVELAAARRKSQVAVVHVAAPLSENHHERLQRALSAQAGMPVQLNVIVEPDLVGGIKVEIGDEVVDGSLAARLDDARRQMTAGHP